MNHDIEALKSLTLINEHLVNSLGGFSCLWSCQEKLAWGRKNVCQKGMCRFQVGKYWVLFLSVNETEK